MKEQNDFMDIDLLRIGKTLLKRIWFIAIAVVIGAAVRFLYATYFVTPTYTSNAQILVVNSAASNAAGRNPTSAELNAAQQLATTYMVIIKSTSTMERVAQKLDLKTSPSALQGMVKTELVPDTEIFKVKVTTSSPEMSKKIADALIDVFPDQIPYPNSVLNVIEKPNLPKTKTSPNRTKYALMGAVIGFILSAGIIIVADMTDDVIRSEDYLTQNYDIPVLVVVPDLHDYAASHSTDYYSSSSSKKKEGAK